MGMNYRKGTRGFFQSTSAACGPLVTLGCHCGSSPSAPTLPALVLLISFPVHNPLAARLFTH